jgi:hypothetical protein
MEYSGINIISEPFGDMRNYLLRVVIIWEKKTNSSFSRNNFQKTIQFYRTIISFIINTWITKVGSHPALKQKHTSSYQTN